MGLTAQLGRFAFERPHLLVVEGSAGVLARLMVERFARERGWDLVDGPADADLLVVAGHAEPLESYLQRVWDALPGPRARVDLPPGAAVEDLLLAARAQLLDPTVQRQDVRRTSLPEADMADMDMSADPHAGHDMGGMTAAAPAADPHAGHDMGGMTAAAPAADPHAGHDMGGMTAAASAPAADPHAGHDMGGMTAAAPAADPHAGHDMGGITATASAPAPDPHAGHDMGGMTAAAPAPDPHAGHDMSSMAGSAPASDPHAGHDMSRMAGSAPASDPHAGHDMSSMAGSAPASDPHAGHDMSSMGGMSMPAGLAMADRAPDRDGLKLDVLTVPLGPVLAWWPAGLVVTAVLQGDVVQEARVEQLVGRAELQDGWKAALSGVTPPVASAVTRLDGLVRLLAVAGWDGGRLRCQHARDALLARETGAATRLHRVAARVVASRTLRQMTTGIATTGGEDVAQRYRRWFTEAIAAVDDGVLPQAADSAHAVHALPGLLAGVEVAAARLVIASLDLELSGADAPVPAGV